MSSVAQSSWLCSQEESHEGHLDHMWEALEYFERSLRARISELKCIIIKV